MSGSGGSILLTPTAPLPFPQFSASLSMSSAFYSSLAATSGGGLHNGMTAEGPDLPQHSEGGASSPFPSHAAASSSPASSPLLLPQPLHQPLIVQPSGEENFVFRCHTPVAPLPLNRYAHARLDYHNNSCHNQEDRFVARAASPSSRPEAVAVVAPDEVPLLASHPFTLASHSSLLSLRSPCDHHDQFEADRRVDTATAADDDGGLALVQSCNEHEGHDDTCSPTHAELLPSHCMSGFCFPTRHHGTSVPLPSRLRRAPHHFLQCEWRFASTAPQPQSHDGRDGEQSAAKRLLFDALSYSANYAGMEHESDIVRAGKTLEQQLPSSGPPQCPMEKAVEGEEEPFPKEEEEGTQSTKSPSPPRRDPRDKSRTRQAKKKPLKTPSASSPNTTTTKRDSPKQKVVSPFSASQFASCWSALPPPPPPPSPRRGPQMLSLMPMAMSTTENKKYTIKHALCDEAIVETFLLGGGSPATKQTMKQQQPPSNQQYCASQPYRHAHRTAGSPSLASTRSSSSSRRSPRHHHHHEGAFDHLGDASLRMAPPSYSFQSNSIPSLFHQCQDDPFHE